MECRKVGKFSEDYKIISVKEKAGGYCKIKYK
jgi:hypothetical protein